MIPFLSRGAVPLPTSQRSRAIDLAATYVENLEAGKHGWPRVTDKMPLNYLHIGLISVLFPNASIVHCVCDPLDTCLSNYFRNFGDSMGFTCDLAELASYYTHYACLMRHWHDVLSRAIHTVRYEALIGDLEGVSREIVDFCGLDWDPRYLSFHENERLVLTASNIQVRRPLYAHSVGRAARYRDHLGPLVHALGGKADS